MSHRDLLLEIGCEELPSSSLLQLGEALGELLPAKLAALNLDHGQVTWFAAPRRLAVRVSALAEQADDEHKEALGPPVAQARDTDGNWTKAAAGFAARQGVEPETLEVFATPKGERLGLRQVIPGVKARDIILSVVNETLRELPVAKRMRWGASRVEFARPVHWVVLLLGEESGFGEVMGIASGNESRGHRFHAPDAVTITSPAAYEDTLFNAKVIADFGQRRELIREQVEACAAELDATAVVDPDLLDEVTSLVEWPRALAGSFDEDFLEVPAEALISSMQSHQKYFPVVDGNGALQPRFITVSNIESRDPEQVIAGNEKVIRPRLADAAFFFNQDRQHSLESRIARLDNVVFQNQLGSLGDKGRRIAALAAELAPLLGAHSELAQRAGLLAKADLVSDMVLEFGDLQGIAGAYYARNDGEDAAVADAIEQHYWPKQAGSALPEAPVALSLALADRLDTLVGIFGIGQPPTGSKDPFALRRASIAVLRLLIEKGADLDLRDCLNRAASQFPNGTLLSDTIETVLAYVLDRLPSLYEGEGIAVDVFRAVRASGCTAPVDFDRRLRAVQAFGGRPQAEALAAANKRVQNILAKAEGLGNTFEVSADLLQETEEKLLFEAIHRVENDNAASLEQRDYDAALGCLAELRDPVDAFFDGVMVNAEDEALRRNRLHLLARLRAQFLLIADISQLAT